MSSIQTIALAATTTGSDGSATGTIASATVFGWLVDVYLDFHASAPNTTDTTLAYTGRGGTILAVANSATDALLAPRQKAVDNANAAITDSSSMFLLSGGVTVSVAGCNALDPAVTVYLRVLRP